MRQALAVLFDSLDEVVMPERRHHTLVQRQLRHLAEKDGSILAETQQVRPAQSEPFQEESWNL